MTFIVPFKEKHAGEVITIYSVNNDNPTEGNLSSVTTYDECPHCNEGHFFRVYDFKSFREDDECVTEIYDCKCPSCRKEFDLEIEFEL